MHGQLPRHAEMPKDEQWADGSSDSAHTACMHANPMSENLRLRASCGKSEEGRRAKKACNQAGCCEATKRG
jgi:hypothetical protein